MPSTLDDVFPVIRPVWMLNTRLAWHSEAGSGRMLDGLKLSPTGTVRQTGKKDLPLLQLVGVSEREEVAVVGGAKGTRADVYTVSYDLFTNADFGALRMNPVDETTKLGFMEWTALIRDAIQVKHDGSGKLDQLLDGMVVRPVIFSIDDNGIDQNVWVGTLNIEMWTMLYYPGNRSCTDRPE
jgi:hypothetical protein